VISRVSVRVLVPALVVLPAVGVAASLGWISVSAGRAGVEDLARQVVDEIGARASRRVEDQLRLAVTASDSTKVLIDAGMAAGAFDPGRPGDAGGVLIAQWRAFPGLSGIAFGGVDGAVVWVAQYPGEPSAEFAVRDGTTGGLVEQSAVDETGVGTGGVLRRVAYDLESRPWYRAVMDVAEHAPAGADVRGWSPIYSWARADGSGETLGISYARSVGGPGNTLVGVLDTELELVGLSRFLSGLRIGESGLAVLIERDGRLVGASRGQSLLGEDGQRRAVWESSDALTRLVGSAARARLGGTDGDGLRRVTLDGDAWWVDSLEISAPGAVGGGAGLEWLLLVAVPESDLLVGVEAAKDRAVRAGAVAFGVAVLVGMLGSVWLMQPILKLRRHVRAVGGGDLDTPIAMTAAREFRELSDEINAMQAGLKDRMRLRQSMELAMEVQQALLPRETPRVPGLDVAGFSAYCDETGGDYYDYLEVDSITPSGLAVVLGDVMGHGIAAALLMATARGVIRSRAGEVGALCELLNYTNRELVHDDGGYRFMTMLLVMIDPGRGELRWASAGQGPPMVYDAAEGRWLEFPTGGMPLGIEETERYAEHRDSVVREGMIVLLSTDGLWEAHDAAGEQFGIERVRAIVEAKAGEPAQAIVDALNAGLAAFCGEKKPEDDVTFVVVKVAG
jgi:sigma-B regulation protein RsbU (phosphoserine phosphatase)